MGSPLRASPSASCIPKFLTELPVRARLSEEVHASFTTVARRTGEQSGALQDFEFGVHRTRAGRIPQLLREILYADDSVSIRYRCADLDAVLSSSEEGAGPLPHGGAASYV
jgi:hypothetical protein